MRDYYVSTTKFCTANNHDAGPVEAHPSVLRQMGQPILGQFDQEFLQIMDEVREMIKVPFATKNQQAFAIDGTSRSGLEAGLFALIEPATKCLCLRMAGLLIY